MAPTRNLVGRTRNLADGCDSPTVTSACAVYLLSVGADNKLRGGSPPQSESVLQCVFGVLSLVLCFHFHFRPQRFRVVEKALVQGK